MDERSKIHDITDVELRVIQFLIQGIWKIKWLIKLEKELFLYGPSMLWWIVDEMPTKLYKIAPISLCTTSLYKWVTPEFWLQNEPPQLWVTCTKPRKSIWLCKQWALTHFHTLTQCTQCALTHAVQGNGGPPITDSVGVHICIFEFRIGICSYFDRNIFQYWPSLFFFMPTIPKSIDPLV